MIEYIITHMSDNFRLHFSNYKGEREKCTLKAKFLHTICLWKGLDMSKFLQTNYPKHIFVYLSEWNKTE